MRASRRWRDWSPPEKNSHEPHYALTKLTKPTKPYSVSFVSADSGCSRIISASPNPRTFDPAAWRQPVTEWLLNLSISSALL
jgi:hypothetical protein